MLIKNITKAELENALAQVNAQFDNNVAFNNLTIAYTRKNGSQDWRVTLKVKSSKGNGARRALSGRRTVGACWHAHGSFIDALPVGAIVQSTMGAQNFETEPRAQWHDSLLGTPYMGYSYMSELCNCGCED